MYSDRYDWFNCIFQISLKPRLFSILVMWCGKLVKTHTHTKNSPRIIETRVFELWIGCHIYGHVKVWMQSLLGSWQEKKINFPFYWLLLIMKTPTAVSPVTPRLQLRMWLYCSETVTCPPFPHRLGHRSLTLLNTHRHQNHFNHQCHRAVSYSHY